MYSIVVTEIYHIKLREKENAAFNVLIILNHQMQILFLTWIAKDRQTYRQKDRKTWTDIHGQTYMDRQAAWTDRQHWPTDQPTKTN